MSNIINATPETYDEIVNQSDVPVLVDFWAPWCGPCKAMKPILEAFADTYEGKMKIVLVNADDHQDFIASQNVRGLPTLKLISNGDESVKVGMQTPALLENWIDSVIPE